MDARPSRSCGRIRRAPLPSPAAETLWLGNLSEHCGQRGEVNGSRLPKKSVPASSFCTDVVLFLSPSVHFSHLRAVFHFEDSRENLEWHCPRFNQLACSHRGRCRQLPQL